MAPPPPNTGVYTEEEILSLLDLQEGDNLFGFSTAEKEQVLLQSLPYLDEVEVHAQLPGYRRGAGAAGD